MQGMQTLKKTRKEFNWGKERDESLQKKKEKNIHEKQTEKLFSIACIRPLSCCNLLQIILRPVDPK